MDLTVAMVLLSMTYQVMSEISGDEDILLRSRRQLLFPNATLLQFNFGLGTPTPVKTINVNWAIQTNFMLPSNRSQIPVDIFGASSGYEGESRKGRAVNDLDGREYHTDDKLCHFYKFIEEVLNSYGDNGTACVLQTLCQIGAEPLHYDEEDILHEIASFVLNPTNDVRGFVEDDTYPYVAAYEKGQNGQECIGQFGVCSTSLVDMFTVVLDNADQL